MPNRKPWMTALLSGACCLLILSPQADAQQRRATEAARQEQAAASQTLRLPPEQPIVTVTVQSPSEVRVGRSFDYQIRVQNNSQNIAVHDLVIAQHAAEGFEIESSEVVGKPDSGQRRQTAPEQNARSQQRKQRAEDESQDKANESADKESADKQKEDKQAREQQRKQDDQQGKPDRKESDRDGAKSDDSHRDDADDRAESQAAESKRSKSNDSAQDESTSDDAHANRSKADQTTDDQARRDDSQRDKSQRRRSASQSGQADGSRWKIARLVPGESRTIRVTAASDSEGTGSVCVAVESYVPAVCLATHFTKPELDIEKKAPEIANICDEIQFEYLVKNTGTGDLQRFTVRDDLPAGLQTIDGAKKLEFTLEDGLKAGGTRKFVARLRAYETGEFTSRAVVEGSGGVEARSNRAGTRVQKADLAVAIDGPQAQEVGGLANYTVRVTNRGDAPAPGTQLRVYFPRSADLVRAGQPRKSNREVTPRSSETPRSDDEKAAHDHRSNAGAGQAGERVDDEARPDAAKSDGREDQDDQDDEDDPDNDSEQKPNDDEEDDEDEDRDQAASKDRAPQPRERRAEARREQSRENQQRQNMAQNHWQLGTLAPGETVEVTYVLRPYEGGELEQAAVAEYVCATAQDREMLRSEVETATEILMLTGLRVTVIDDHDPVAVGQNVSYTITVLNQGNAPAHAVEISARLPKELKYLESKGASSGEASENEIDFKPVEILEPGQKAVWQIVARVKEGVGEKTQSSIEVELNSDDLDESITSQEPTTLFEGEKRTAKASDEEESEKK